MAHVTFSLTHEFILLQFRTRTITEPSPQRLHAAPRDDSTHGTGSRRKTVFSSDLAVDGLDARLHGIVPRGLLDGEVL